MSELNKILETDCYKNYLKDIDYLNKVLDKYKTIDIEKSSNYIYELFYFNKKFNQLLSKDSLEPLLREKLESVTNNLKVVLDSLENDTLRKIYENHKSAVPISKLEKEKYKGSTYKGNVKKVVKENPIKVYLLKSFYKPLIIFICLILLYFLDTDTCENLLSNTKFLYIELLQVYKSGAIVIFSVIMLSFSFFYCLDFLYIVFPGIRYKLFYNFQNEDTENIENGDNSSNWISPTAVQSIEEGENGRQVREYVPDKIERSRKLVQNIRDYVIENNLDLGINKKVDSLETLVNKCVRKNKNHYELYESCVKIELLYEQLVNSDK